MSKKEHVSIRLKPELKSKYQLEAEKRSLTLSAYLGMKLSFSDATPVAPDWLKVNTTQSVQEYLNFSDEDMENLKLTLQYS